MTELQQPPASDEVEVSLFGPGVGECVVVHLGQGDWMVVDSCIERASGRPIALEYLKRLGVDVSKAVKLVVVTHWHDDHISGACDVLRAAQSAEVVCSAALCGDEFYALVATAEGAMMKSSGIAEFAAIFEILQQNVSKSPVWGVADRSLLRLQGPGRIYPAEVHSLSPSDRSITLAQKSFAQQLPRYGAPKRRVVAQSPNQAAVVLWVKLGDICVLLGSDLEKGDSLSVGWQAIVGSTTRPSGHAQVFKVPHHGSENADSTAVWSQMLGPNPYALLTPFASGSKPRPSPSDIRRLSNRTPNLYCTASPNGWSPPRRPSAVEKTVNEVTRNRRAVMGPMGHIRVRSRCTLPAIEVELFGGAYCAASRRT